MPFSHDVYRHFIGLGMPEALSNEDQVVWLLQHLKEMERKLHRHGPIVGWLVYAPLGDENDYYLFGERRDAEDKKNDFETSHPDEEFAIEALICHPEWKETE